MHRPHLLFSSAALAIGGAAFALASGSERASIAPASTTSDSLPGEGGPGGDFDWILPAGERVVIDTSYALLRGGPNGAQTTAQEVFDGVVHVRDLVVPNGTTLFVQGPNPLRIYAGGDVHVDGTISVDGGDAEPVYTLNTPTIPSQGAPGCAGGGNGGTGSRYIDRVTPVGGPGAGAFGAGGIGGQGGESGWSPNNSISGELHRAAGGGGGVFGPDQLAAGGCLEQSVIGLDAEDGFPGATTAFSGLRPTELMPWGGRRGRGPFHTNDPLDDFYGRMLANAGTPSETLVTGELPSLWAGAGGGGGGDGTFAASYPPPTLIPTATDKGAGGGGGAGGLLIAARGDIVLGPFARISADGGHGSGGENTNFVNRVGGGSGGGSGGHIVLSSLAHLDLSQLSTTTPAITARGGEGGAGANNNGGADDLEITPLADAKHRGVTGPNDTSDNPWIPPVPIACVPGQGVVRAAGGDGGPGVIQFHVRDLSAILPPAGDVATIRDVVQPAPVGYSAPDELIQHFVHLLLPTH